MGGFDFSSICMLNEDLTVSAILGSLTSWHFSRETFRNATCPHWGVRIMVKSPN